MGAMVALVRREFLEHKGAFLYAPVCLLIVLGGAGLFAAGTGRTDVELPTGPIPAGLEIYDVGISGSFFVWRAYLLIMLFFYFADSFSADRRDNALLFWKSMPQSDLKILAAKALSAITIFLALIFAFAVATAVLVFVALSIVTANHPIIAPPPPGAALWSLVRLSGIGLIYMLVAVLWHAPILAWVAGLSTIFRGWSIPLAFLIPGAIILIEYVVSLRGVVSNRPVANFLDWRFQGFTDEIALFETLTNRIEGGPEFLLRQILSGVDWLHLALGLLFSAAIVFAASEYRRRKIDA